MAQCNRCGASFSSTMSRALKVHRLHCPKNMLMKFKEPTSRARKLTKDIVRKNDDISKVFDIVILKF